MPLQTAWRQCYGRARLRPDAWRVCRGAYAAADMCELHTRDAHEMAWASAMFGLHGVPADATALCIERLCFTAGAPVGTIHMHVAWTTAPPPP
jgi:hypothetical protein